MARWAGSSRYAFAYETLDITERLEIFGFLIGNFDLEGLFDGHHKLDHIERISSEVLENIRIARKISVSNTQLIANKSTDSIIH
jgi:hypothetical protein